jgi:DNA (cytosine-5)-methyltransferase 1
MKVLDLFSGIGGFSLGLERAGMETVAFCEFDEHAQKVLRKHWPDVPIHSDVRTLNGYDFRGTVDVVCGGFPCQDLSTAGKQVGFGGERSSLYREMLRVIGECMPRYAIFENVTGLISGDKGRWFAKFLYDLAEIGFDAEWHCITASDLGAHHHRDRVWIIAYPCGSRSKVGMARQNVRQEGDTRISINLSNEIRRARREPGMEGWSIEPNVGRVANGVPNRAHRLKQLGNAVVPQIPEAIGRAIMEVAA